MKRQVLRFGIATAVLYIATMAMTLRFMDTHRMKVADAFGYPTIVLAALLIFFGVRSYRATRSEGLSFGRGVTVGLAITLVACVIHVAVFEIVYFGLVPGLGEKYAECMVERARLAGVGPAELATAQEKAHEFRVLFDQPLWNVALTFTPPFLTGLFASLVSAVILRRPANDPAAKG